MSDELKEFAIFVGVLLVTLDRAVALYLVKSQAKKVLSSTGSHTISRKTTSYKALSIFEAEFQVILMVIVLGIFCIYGFLQISSPDSTRYDIGSAVVGFIAFLLSMLGTVISIVVEKTNV